VTSPHDVPPERAPVEDPGVRPFYYPWGGTGCLFWAFIFILLYVVVGLLWAPVRYPLGWW